MRGLASALLAMVGLVLRVSSAGSVILKPPPGETSYICHLTESTKNPEREQEGRADLRRPESPPPSSKHDKHGDACVEEVRELPGVRR